MLQSKIEMKNIMTKHQEHKRELNWKRNYMKEMKCSINNIRKKRNSQEKCPN